MELAPIDSTTHGIPRYWVTELQGSKGIDPKLEWNASTVLFLFHVNLTVRDENGAKKRSWVKISPKLLPLAILNIRLTLFLFQWKLRLSALHPKTVNLGQSFWETTPPNAPVGHKLPQAQKKNNKLEDSTKQLWCSCGRLSSSTIKFLKSVQMPVCIRMFDMILQKSCGSRCLCTQLSCWWCLQPSVVRFWCQKKIQDRVETKGLALPPALQQLCSHLVRQRTDDDNSGSHLAFLLFPHPFIFSLYRKRSHNCKVQPVKKKHRTLRNTLASTAFVPSTSFTCHTKCMQAMHKIFCQQTWTTFASLASFSVFFDVALPRGRYLLLSAWPTQDPLNREAFMRKKSNATMPRLLGRCWRHHIESTI